VGLVGTAAAAVLKRGSTDCEPAQDGLAVARCTFRNNTAAVTGEPSVRCVFAVAVIDTKLVCSSCRVVLSLVHEVITAGRGRSLTPR
jgi:hypothetical protein